MTSKFKSNRYKYSGIRSVTRGKPIISRDWYHNNSYFTPKEAFVIPDTSYYLKNLLQTTKYKI